MDTPKQNKTGVETKMSNEQKQEMIKGTKELSTAAKCASAIRKELKQKFPLIKFRVTSENFAGGNSVNIYYTDGVSKDEIYLIVSKYQEGNFNMSSDLYEYNNTNKDIPQAKYIFVNREFSNDFKLKAMKELAKKWNVQEQQDLSKSFILNDLWVNFDQLIWREYNDKTI